MKADKRLILNSVAYVICVVVIWLIDVYLFSDKSKHVKAHKCIVKVPKEP